jgi:hypothetical protein
MNNWTVWAAAGAIALAAPGQADELKMATIAPGTSAYLVMSTMATLVNQQQDDIDITVDATGAATKHIIDMAEGKLDMVMTSPTVYAFMKSGTAMYQKLSKAPELSRNVGLVLWFPYGAYHVITYADSGIESLDDLRGKSVFLGPPGGGAWNTAMRWVKANTGMEPGVDYDNFKASWSSGFQAFQDRQVDVYINGGIPPFPQVEQLAATSKIRIIGPDSPDALPEAAVKVINRPGGSLDVIAKGIYGANHVNETDVYSTGSTVGVAARLDLDADTVYAVTKAFWEGAEAARGSTPWLSDVTLDYAVKDGGLPLHPGAQRYYEEIGLTIPEASMALSD